eukprot:m.189574 g.189574  ORF g.189574 m.189574 type:complete len:275 (-) comp24861_c0_seq2:2162-2986(-)
MRVPTLLRGLRKSGFGAAFRRLHRHVVVCGCEQHTRSLPESSQRPLRTCPSAALAVGGVGVAPTRSLRSAITLQDDFYDGRETPGIADIFENNRKWVKRMTEGDDKYFEKLAASHKPEYLWIGCSDARVPANEIMGLGPGEVFVHRNIANMVVNSDMNINAVLQYAVQYLNVKHIIVAGHYDCGGVKAAMEAKDLGLVENWLGGVRDVYRLHQHELDSIEDISLRSAGRISSAAYSSVSIIGILALSSHIDSAARACAIVGIVALSSSTWWSNA